MGRLIYLIIHELKAHTLVEVIEELLRGVKGFGGWVFLLYQNILSNNVQYIAFKHIKYISQKYTIHMKKGKLESAKHRRIFMPIWFHSLPILLGSAAGAAALKCHIRISKITRRNHKQ